MHSYDADIKQKIKLTYRYANAHLIFHFQILVIKEYI